MLEYFLQLIFLLHIVLLPAYLYFSWNFNYWQSRGLRTALPLTIFGSFPSILTRNRNLIYEIDAIYGRYKHRSRMVGIYFVRQPQILVLDMRLAHEVLDLNFNAFEVTAASSWMRHHKENKLDKLAMHSAMWSTGERWKKNRTVACAALTLRRLKRSYEVWLVSSRHLLHYLGQKCGDAQPEIVEVTDFVERFVADALCIFIWGVDAGTLTLSKKGNRFLMMAQRAVKQTRSLSRYSFVSAVMPLLWRLWPFRLISKTVDSYFMQFTVDALECHMKLRDPCGAPNFLSYLDNLRHSGLMSDDALTGNCMAMLIDGFEEVCSTLAYTIYYLAKEPRVQAKLRAELVQTQRRENCKELSFDTLMSLSYLDHCIYETLRLSPIVPYCRRVCSNANVVQLSKHKTLQLDDGMMLCVPVYSYHHDPLIFCEPNSFMPERFENVAPKELMESRVFLPFGAGPRSCLGKDLAMVIIKSALVPIVSQFAISTCGLTQHGNNQGIDSFLLNLNEKLMLEIRKL
ncbi:probable cytochrome P450 309a2 [Anastrepha obliqua]|uniref:probable cytochrome P450 309a2 n=1 Tax=Anastrepha obliqua TaxID=95512 RepID=UPI0024098C9C|nr:probable cytochrome P450 309a2 [Anastrepha obliqua]